jgi:hypothetical protein
MWRFKAPLTPHFEENTKSRRKKNRIPFAREYPILQKVSLRWFDPTYHRPLIRKKTIKVMGSTKSGCSRWGTPVTAAITSVATKHSSHARTFVFIWNRLVCKLYHIRLFLKIVNLSKRQRYTVTCSIDTRSRWACQVLEVFSFSLAISSLNCRAIA